MAFACLPLEILTSVFKHLCLSDRLAASLVCKQWYFATLDSRLQKDVSIVMHGEVSLGMEALAKGHRTVLHLVLKEGDILSNCTGFWETVGPGLLRLDIHSCDISERAFVEALSKCVVLEALSIIGCNGLLISGTFLEKFGDIQKLEVALQNIKELNLSSNRYLSDALFNRMVRVLPNIEKLSLANCQISFHPGIFKRFYPKGNDNVPSGSVFTFQNIMKFIEANSNKIKSLNFSQTLIDNRAVNILMSAKDLHLEELYLSSCEQLSNAAAQVVCEKQRSLKILDLSLIYKLHDEAALNICDTLRELVVFSLRRCHYLTDNSIGSISNMKYLERLDLSSCEKVTSSGFLAALCSCAHPRLRWLNLSYCNITDAAIISIAQHLPNLTHLDLSSCRSLTDKSLHAIAFTLVHLRSLKLAWCNNITDRGLTGGRGRVSMDNSSMNKLLSSSFANSDTDGLTSRQRPSRLSSNPFIVANMRERGSAESIPMNTISVEVKSCNASSSKIRQEECAVPALSNIKGLKELDLCGCVNIGDVGLKTGIWFLELKYLNLSLCQNITDDGLVTMGRHNPSLETLILSQCCQLTDRGIEGVVVSLHRLKHLDVQGCKHLTDATLHCLSQNCMDMQYLNVSLCHRMTLETVENLEYNLPRLHTVHKRHIQPLQVDTAVSL